MLIDEVIGGNYDVLKSPQFLIDTIKRRVDLLTVVKAETRTAAAILTEMQDKLSQVTQEDFIKILDAADPSRSEKTRSILKLLVWDYELLLTLKTDTEPQTFRMSLDDWSVFDKILDTKAAKLDVIEQSENVITHRIPADHYIQLSNSKLLCYLDNEQILDDQRIITQNPLTEEHLWLSDVIDSYAEINQKADVTVFSLTMITREFYHIKKKNAPTIEQLRTVEALLETLAHTHIIQPNDKGEPVSRVILYLETTFRRINGQPANSYILKGFSALRYYAHNHNIKYTRIKCEYIRLPQGFHATTKNVILFYVIIRALKERKTELSYDYLYDVYNARNRKDRLTVRTRAKEMLLKCSQSEGMRKELALKGFSILEDDSTNKDSDLQPIGFELEYQTKQG